MSAYYNEIDPFAAAWLRELIKAGQIAPGEVDERSIVDVQPADLLGFSQCHFFAGIGGWSYALRLAGWPDDRAVWTGSCPCQPFSSAGPRKGFADERHLWPAWRPLIKECRPATVFGEQSAAAHEWLRLVRSDLDRMGYAVGCIPIQAALLGADHERDRYWFVAGSNFDCQPIRAFDAEVASSPLFTADIDSTRLSGRGPAGADSEDAGNIEARNRFSYHPARTLRGHRAHQPVLGSGVHGLPNRVGAVRGFGNAIVPQVAAEVIRAYMEIAA